MFRSITYILTVALLVVGGSVLAQAPNTITYQGKLTDAGGAAITGATDVVFAIYAAASGGSALWSSGTVSIDPDDNGVFTVELGPIPPNVFDGSKRYLGITVSGDPQMTPRQLITSAPYAQFTSGLSGANYDANDNPNSLVELSGTPQSVASVTLQAPAAGFAVVTAEAEAFVTHVNGTYDNVIFKVSPTAGDVNTPSFQATVVRIPAEWPTSTQRYVVPVSITHLFPVTAGNNTFHLNAYSSSGTGNDDLLAPNLTAIYVPFQYGTSSVTAGPSPDSDEPDLMLVDPSKADR